MYAYVSVRVSLYIHIYLYLYISGLPSWYIIMWGQTSGRGTQIYSHKSHIFVDEITTVVTTSVYIKYIYRFKTI